MPNISTNYLYTGKGPFDAKSLKDTYDELLSVATWTVDDSFVAYNGMIVAVWKDSLSSNNGIYYLSDPSYTGKRGTKPDVTNSANWHKISDTIDVSAIQNAIQDLEDRLDALEAVEDKVHTFGYRKDFPEPSKETEGHMYVAADQQRTYVCVNGAYVLVGTGFEETESGEILIYGGSADDEEN